MKASELASIWASPDNTRLTAKQYSFRLPVHVAAKLAAICEMYPQKTRTQIVADLLTAALEEFPKSFPSVVGRYFGKDDEGRPMYEDAGQSEQYRELTNKHFKELETELGNTDPQDFFVGALLVYKEE